MLVDEKLVSHAGSKLVNQFIILGGKCSAVTAEYSKVVVFYNHFIENFETSHSMSLYMGGFKVRKKLFRLTIKIRAVIKFFSRRSKRRFTRNVSQKCIVPPLTLHFDQL